MAKPWEVAFPHLGVWECHSPATPPGGRTPRYNCYAFAAGDDTQRWEPDPAEQYPWPPTAPRAWPYTVPLFIQGYQKERYEVCGDGLQERDYEKIVIYTDALGIVKHAARQISDGRWTSKLGDAEDIIHETPQSLASPIYGQPVCYMRRRKAPLLAGLYSWVIGLIAWLKAVAGWEDPGVIAAREEIERRGEARPGQAWTVIARSRPNAG
jgi:hypothetical protein